MNLRADFASIESQYVKLNNEYSAKENIALSNGFSTYNKWKNKRELNDAIHFLFVFSRFEAYVRVKSEKYINDKITSTGYSRKAPWEILKDYGDADQLHFMKRVQVSIPKNHGDFATIRNYLKIRNNLAHGGPYNTPIDVIGAINDLLTISRIIS